ncbi:unnamed protein product [Ectocarpus sp. CCAP 1310/34]|nr:unnamed protein product [Ectocarpus sp. CCAP 1310/34]
MTEASWFEMSLNMCKILCTCEGHLFLLSRNEKPLVAAFHLLRLGPPSSRCVFHGGCACFREVGNTC